MPLIEKEMKWYFMRHCEIESNIKNIYAGWSDEALTERGIEQAKNLGKRLKKLNIGSIYTSPLKRAVQTAEIIGDILNLDPIINGCFKELKLGVWEGLNEDKIAKNFPEEWEIWNIRPADLIMEGRETLQELLGRVRQGIRKVRSNVNTDKVLVVTHVAIIRVLFLISKGLDMNLYRTILVPNGKMFKFEDSLLLSSLKLDSE